MTPEINAALVLVIVIERKVMERKRTTPLGLRKTVESSDGYQMIYMLLATISTSNRQGCGCAVQETQLCGSDTLSDPARQSSMPLGFPNQ
jgi:hypothetical protein